MSKVRINLGSMAIAEDNNTTMDLIPPTRLRAISKYVLRSYAMSGSLTLNIKANVSRNPRNYPPNSYTVCNSDSTILQSAVETIQRVVSQREMRHAEKIFKKIIQDQAYRVSITKCLSTYIRTNTCEKLLLGSEDAEVLKVSSLYDKRHINMETRHVTEVLQAPVDCTRKI